MSKKKTEPIVVEPTLEQVDQCCGKDECLYCPFDEPTVESVPEVVDEPCCYIVKDGDSWASIAAENAPQGIKKHDYAKHLVELNGNKILRPGTKVIL